MTNTTTKDFFPTAFAISCEATCEEVSMNYTSELVAGIGPAPPEPESGVLTTAKQSSPTALTIYLKGGTLQTQGDFWETPTLVIRNGFLHLFRFIKRSNPSLRQSPPYFTLSKISLSIWVQSYDTTTHCFCVSEKSFGEHTNFSEKASFPLYPYTWNSIRGKSYCSNKGSVKTV